MGDQYVPMQMQTASLLSGSSSRPSFRGIVKRFLKGEDEFEIVCFSQGLLFLHSPTLILMGNNANKGAIIGGVMGGALGALAGAAIDAGRAAPNQPAGENLALLSDEELMIKARSRKASFVCEYEDVKWATADPPSSWTGRYAGTIAMKIAKVGKLTIGLIKPNDMMNALDALEKRLGDRLTSNVAWDQRNLRYVAKA